MARAAAVGAPTIATAALATAVGFLVLLLSPVPMVRGFGVLLVIGIAIALACALTAGSAALALKPGDGGVLEASAARRRRHPSAGVRVEAGRWRRARRGRDRARRGSTAPAASPSAGRGGVALDEAGRCAHRPTARPRSCSGWRSCSRSPAGSLDTQTSVQSDITKLVPTTMPALRDLRTLEHVTGVSGEIDVTVRAADVTKAPVVRWMASYEQSLLQHYGYLETKGCAHATLCPALSLPDLFSGGVSSTVEALVRAEPELDQQPARRGAEVLLAGRDHAGPPRGDARVRDPADAAVQAAAGDRLHDLAAAPARRGHRAARRAAGAGGAGERGAVIVRPPAADAGRRAARRRARAARGVP